MDVPLQGELPEPLGVPPSLRAWREKTLRRLIYVSFLLAIPVMLAITVNQIRIANPWGGAIAAGLLLALIGIAVAHRLPSRLRSWLLVSLFLAISAYGLYTFGFHGVSPHYGTLAILFAVVLLGRRAAIISLAAMTLLVLLIYGGYGSGLFPGPPRMSPEALRPAVLFNAGLNILTIAGVLTLVLAWLIGTFEQSVRSANNSLAAFDQLRGQAGELVAARDEHIRRNATLLQATQRVARVGGWEYDTDSRALAWTDELYDMFEVPRAVVPNLELLPILISPQQWPTLEAAIKRLLDDGTPYDLELPAQTASGRQLWVRVIGSVERGGSVDRYVGAVQDITARKQADRALQAAHARLETLLDHSPAVIFSLRGTGDFGPTFVSANVHKLIGYRPEDFTGDKNIHRECTHPHDEALVEQGIDRLRVDGHATYEYRFRCADGVYRWMRVAVRLVYDGDGQPLEAVGYWIDINEHKQAAQELERAWLAAEEATRAKSEFVAQMSHEIRTPLNAVLGLTTLLLNSPLSAAQRDDVETIRSSGSALLTLIDDILDFSKIEAGKLTLEYQPFALRACVEEALDLLAPLADAKQLALHYQPDPALPDMFVGDPARLRQILVNLLSNAVRFTKRGSITLTLTGAAREPVDEPARWWELTLSVRDTGIGIAPEQQEQIFQPFIQAGALIGQGYGGTGLGLTISRRLATLMGGEIGVVSMPGAGSTFTVAVALEATADPPPAFLAPVQPLLAGKRALLLVEKPARGAMLVQHLTRWGMVPMVYTASEALAVLAANQPVDVLLLVHEHAAAPAVALVDALRAAATQPAMPTVLWAAASQRGAALGHFDPASTAVLPLPLRPAALHDALGRLLGTSNAPLAAPETQLDATLGVRHPLRILLAEDNATNQQVAQRLLAKLGYGVDVAATGLEVLEALRRQPYDLVLMDVQMPAMSGTEATHYIRSYWPPERQPRIAAMTAYASEENRAWLLRTGMDDYVRKPVRPPELVRVLQAASDALGDGRQQVQWEADTTIQPIHAGVLSQFLLGVGTGDAAADEAFLARYVADMDAQVRQLHAALASGEEASLARTAHTLKGLSLQVGAFQLALLCARLEAADPAGDTAGSTEILASIDAVYPAVRCALLA